MIRDQRNYPVTSPLPTKTNDSPRYHFRPQFLISEQRKITSRLQWKCIMLESRFLLLEETCACLIPDSPTGWWNELLRAALGNSILTTGVDGSGCGTVMLRPRSSSQMGLYIACLYLPESANLPLSRELDPGALQASVYSGAKRGWGLGGCNNYTSITESIKRLSNSVIMANISQYLLCSKPCFKSFTHINSSNPHKILCDWNTFSWISSILRCAFSFLISASLKLGYFL